MVYCLQVFLVIASVEPERRCLETGSRPFFCLTGTHGIHTREVNRMSWRSRNYGRSRLIIIAHDAGVPDFKDLADRDAEGGSLGTAYGSNIYTKLTKTYRLSHDKAVYILEGVARYTDVEAHHIASTYS